MNVDSGVITTAELSDEDIAAIVQKQQGETDSEGTNEIDDSDVPPPPPTATEATKSLQALKRYFESKEKIKFSPKCDVEIQPGSPGVHVLCPTRWTVPTDALKSVIDNYATLQNLWEVCYEDAKDTEIKARIQGVGAQMSKFEYYYAISLAEMVLRHTDNLSKRRIISAAEGQEVACLVNRTLQSLREDTHACTF